MNGLIKEEEKTFLEYACDEMDKILNTKHPKGYFACECGKALTKGKKKKNEIWKCSWCE